jgi:hypothetical protein
MPYVRVKRCVYKKTAGGNKGKKEGCSKTVAKAKKYVKKLHMAGEGNLKETERDAKVLRNINIDFLKKEVEKNPDEEIRDYFARLQQMERENPPIFPVELVSWIEGLDDRYFPRDGRKVFAKWLGNAVWHEEAEERSTPGPDFSELDIYNNDIRYIVDYLNGADNVPREDWSLTFPQMMDNAQGWHEELKGVESVGDYVTKRVVHNFKNGFTIVEVPTKDLEVEGNKMGHCVGEYCDYVGAGKTVIFSLRDKKNEPHATIEAEAGGEAGEYRTQGLTAYSDTARLPAIEQIKGKGNDIPAEKYRPMIKQWLATTNYKYKESDDYFDMLSTEEILQMLEGDKLSNYRLQKVVSRAKSPQIIDFLVSKIGSGMFGIGSKSPLANLAGNRHLNLEQATAIFKKNLPLTLLGRQVENLFLAPDYNADDLAAAVWPIVKETVSDSQFQAAAFFEGSHPTEIEEVMFSISAIVSHSSNEELNREVVDLLLDKQVIKSLISGPVFVPGRNVNIKGSAYKLYANIIQSYLFSTDHHDRDTLKKIHELTKSSAGKDLAPPDNIESYIAKSQSIPGDLAAEIANNPVGYITTKNLVMNPSVDESLKYGMVKRLLKTSRITAIIKMLGRAMWEEQKVFSEKFLLWSLDATVFDAIIKRKADMDFTREYGRAAEFHLDKLKDKTTDKNWYDLFQKEKERKREDIKREKAFQHADTDPERELPPWMEDQLNEGIEYYLNQREKKMKKKTNLKEEIKDYFETKKKQEIEEYYTQEMDEEHQKDLQVIQGWITEMENEEGV